MSTDFYGMRLCEKDFSGQDLRGASFVKAELDLSNLSQANLTGSNLVRADAVETDFRGATLRGSDMRHGCFAMSRFEGADMREANLEGVSFEEAFFDDTTRLAGAKVDGVMPFSMFVNGAEVGPDAAVEWFRQRAGETA